MLYEPNRPQSRLEDSSSGTTSAEYGAAITASGSTHTKGSYTALVASTGADAWGITVACFGGGTASTRINFLVDIATGAGGSEQVIIPNLLAGAIADSGGAQSAGRVWHFPIKIPASTRIAARCQANNSSDVVNCMIWLHRYRVPGQWYGQRVTAYGPDTATSTGVSMSPANNSYATNVNLSASTTNPIKYLQIAGDLLTDTTGSNARGLIRLASDSTTLVDDLPYGESTTTETVDCNIANLILSRMSFNIPAGKTLAISAMRNATAEARGWAAYGVD